MRGRRSPDEAATAPPSEVARAEAPPAPLDAIAEATSAQQGATPATTAPIARGALALARLAGEGDLWQVRVGGQLLPARLDAAMHPSVAATARTRGEAVLVTRDDDDTFVVVGALRTSPTPGVDAMDEIALSAKRVRIEATEDAEVRSGVAVIALRAVGEIETYADRIVSRAEEVQKIVARMLRLN